jgi:hypothetical protein
MTRKATLILIGLLVALAPTCSSTAGSVDMKPGEWSITIKTKMEGMPFSPPPVTVKQCLTEQNYVPSGGAQQQGQSQDCEVMDQKIDGNTVSWSVVCKSGQGGTVKGTGTVTYSGSSFQGSTQMTMMTGGQTMKMSTEMTGKWIGPCKK